LASAELAATKASSAGIFAGTSNIRARAYGLAWVGNDLFSASDALSIGVQAPLRVFSGHAQVLIPEVDPDTGVPFFTNERAELAPTGNEIDYNLAYSIEFGERRALGAQVSWQRDALNVQDSSDTRYGLVWTQRF
jgi:hypothetical protein